MALDIHKKKNFIQAEINLIVKLVEKFGEDWKYISMMVKKKFNNLFLCPSKCKTLWERYCKQHNWEWLTKEEFEDVYIRYKLCIVKEKCGIWKKMTRHINRPEDSVKTRFFLALRRTIIYLIYFYAEEAMKPFFYVRFNCFNTCIYTTIIYLSQYIPTKYDKENDDFLQIQKSCKNFINWLEILIKLELYNHKDYKFFLNIKVVEVLPVIDLQEFESAIELILLLDTLNRIMLSQIPYEDHYAARKPKVQYDEDDESQEDSEDDVSLQERPIYVPWDLNRKQQNRGNFSNPEKCVTRKRIYGGFKLMPKMTKKQKQLVLNSEVAQRLLPIQCKVSLILKQ